MKFCIHPSLTNTPYYFVWNDGEVGMSKTPPNHTLILDHETIQTLSKLYLVTLPSFPPENYLKAFQGLASKTMPDRIPWSLCVTAKAFRGLVEGVLEESATVLEALDLTYYQTIYQQGGKVLEHLSPMLVSVEHYQEEGLKVTQNAVFKGFKPLDMDTGELERVEYSRTKAVTGRLTVTSGPNIMLLKRELRPLLLKSRFGDEGSIYELDYKCLEPRVILAHNRPELVERLPWDIYEHVKTELFREEVHGLTRELVKRVIISELYGSGFETLSQELSLVREVDYVIHSISDYFMLPEMKERLIKENDANDRKFITNLYGRRISTIDAKPYMLVNYWSQSTAVDVALCGFSSIVSKVQELDRMDTIVPLAVNVDALYLDVHKDSEFVIPTLCKIGSLDAPRFDERCSFYLTPKKLIRPVSP